MIITRKFANYLFVALAMFLAVGIASRSAAAQGGITQVIAFNTIVGADEPGPALPGDAYEISFSAERGQQLSFATMMVQSNDRFFSPNEQGIALYDANGNPRTGDVTDWVYLFDAGTEIDERPGSGPNQVIRQPAPNTGPADTNDKVRYAHDEFGITPAVNKLINATLSEDDGTFTLRLENASGGDFISPLSPGVVVLHSGVAPLFDIGLRDRGQGLEAIAEDGNPMPLVQSLSADNGDDMDEDDEDDDSDTSTPPAPAPDSNVYVFNTPVGADEPGPALPGNSYEVTFRAQRGEYISFATMMVQSNDRFFAPYEWGIPVYDNSGRPISGDITAAVYLWDAGTEIDEEPGVGPNQVIRQSGPDTGAADPNNKVRYAFDSFGITPPTNELIKVTLRSLGGDRFVLRMENISTPDNFASPLSPGLAIVHSNRAPLFTVGQPDRGQGLEAIAEDGNPMMLAGSLMGHDNGGTTPPPAPSGDSVHVFNTPVGASEPGPALPGNAYEVTFSAERGQTVSFATMMVQSNDRFFAPFEFGIALYDAAGNPRSGDVTDKVYLFDAGTEIDEEPGAGPNQVIRQSGPDTGPADPNNRVRYAVDSFGITPPTNQLIKVTLQSLGNDMFTLRMENVSTPDNFASPLSPGVVVVHSERAPLFTVGQPDRGQGLEAIAEDGNPMPLAMSLGN